jgi:lipocalin
MYLQLKIIMNDVPVISFILASSLSRIITSIPNGLVEWNGTWYDLNHLPDEFNDAMCKIDDCWLPY